MLVFCLGALTLGPCAALYAQEVAVPNYWDLTIPTSPGLSFYVEWERDADLDGDGKRDFRYIIGRCGESVNIEDFRYGYSYDSETIAFFAERHVQVYMRPLTNDVYGQTALPEAVIAYGTQIPATPPKGSAWKWISPYDIPALKGVGYGVTLRSIWWNDVHLPSPSWEIGYLRLSEARPLWNATFSIRIQRSDGWHTGWLTLRWTLFPAPTHFDCVQMVEYAVSPEPNADIVAGVHVGPPLQITTSTTNGATSIRVSWPTNATNLALEAKRSWTATNWMAVQGVTNNEVTITPWSSSAFFRLRGQ